MGAISSRNEEHHRMKATECAPTGSTRSEFCGQCVMPVVRCFFEPRVSAKKVGVSRQW